MSPDLGCYGNQLVNTPNIDSLASEGMRFENVFTTGPACSPSRTALATGVYQTTLGAFHMRYPEELMPDLPDHVRLLPQLLSDAGYATGNLKDVRGAGMGKDDWLFKSPEKVWDTHDWSELVSQQPFYGVINMKESHRAFARSSKAKVDASKVVVPPYYPDHEISRDDWAGYLEDVNRADELVGGILQQLEEDGLRESTIVVFLSDHGRPMMRAKNWLYDSGTQVPLVIWYPDSFDAPARFRKGGSSDQLISGVDLVAETLRMAGVEIPGWMQGRSFLSSDAVDRDYVVTAVDRIGNIDSRSRAIRSKRYKYIENSKQPGSVNDCATAYRRAMHPTHHLLDVMGERGLLNDAQERLVRKIDAEELYDLEKDPFETTNLIDEIAYADVADEMRRQLASWKIETSDQGFEPDSPAVVDYFTNYGKKSSKDLKKYGATSSDKLTTQYLKLRAKVESSFEK
ncbi:sulfatase [Pelagicoccus mobilis]|uniref:Sulfatase n=2 Tax=Pelagicoccus mobilis TaxID=415221 RepID=A0A934S0V4_9BACT|nr:sulfatase [Pelagicoccus mobilis]